MLSGQQLQAAQTFGQNYAMQNAWNPYVSQLNSLASLGENAGAMTGQIGQATGANVAQTQLAAGQAAASGTVGSANAITGGINTGIYSGLNAGLLGYGLQNQQNFNAGSPGTIAASNYATDINAPTMSSLQNYFGGYTGQ